MKRTIISAAVLALGLAGAGVSLADPGDGGGGPSFNGNNDYGLCNAYFHHSNGQPAPFQRLQEAYDAQNGDGAFEDYCTTVLAGDGSPGNSEHGHGGKG